MRKITESELKDRVAGLREYLAVLEAGPAQQPGFASNGGGAAFGNPHITAQGQKAGATQAAPQAAATVGKTKPPAKPTAPMVAYDKNYPPEMVKQLQNMLNAAGEKLTVDGKMGPATRQAQARHPEITTQDPAAQQYAQSLAGQAPAQAGDTTVPPPSDELRAQYAQDTAPIAAPAQAAAAPGATTPAPAAGGLVDGSGKPVTSSNGQQVRTGQQAAPSGLNVDWNALAAKQQQQESVSYTDMDPLARIIQLSR